MSGVQATNRFVIHKGMDEGYIEHMREQVRDKFARELVRHLSERGGIVGPIHEEERQVEDWLLATDDRMVWFTVFAHVTDLPDPETYRLIGGPADGRMIAGRGERTIRLPYYQPVSIVDSFDPRKTTGPAAAEYERRDDTPVYVFRGLY